MIIKILINLENKSFLFVLDTFQRDILVLIQLNQVPIQFYARIMARLLLILGFDNFATYLQYCHSKSKMIAALLCRGNWKVQQNDQYNNIPEKTGTYNVQGGR